MRRERARDRRRPGFTLIELAVVIAVIGILVALIIPAVSGAREASRRAQCANHLKQIGVALGNHAAQFGRFPSGILPGSPDGPGPRSSAHVLSPQFQLLPFLEQTALFDGINVEIDQRVTDVPANATAIAAVVGVFLCPSDPDGFAPGNSYRACSGTDGNDVGGDGAFPGLRFTTPADFSDGLSQTAGFSERTRGLGRRGFDRRRDFWFSGISGVRPPKTSDELAAACALLASSPPEFWNQSGRWWCVGRFADTLYNHVAPPNWEHADCSANRPTGRPGDVSTGAISARSPHPSGAHVLFMDGSTRLVREGVDRAVWRAMGSRSGGEPIANSP